MKLVFATHNPGKALEIQHLVGDSYSIRTLEDIGCTTDIAETGTTLKENAALKSRYVYDHYHINCFADDTGLMVDALNGEPGVYSARYAGEQKNTSDNIRLLLKNLEGKETRGARFVTIISLIVDGQTFFFEGILHGTIIREQRGTNGFGYDPVFVPEGYEKTLAELPLDEKNRISHRAKAFEQLKVFLQEI